MLFVVSRRSRGGCCDDQHKDNMLLCVCLYETKSFDYGGKIESEFRLHLILLTKISAVNEHATLVCVCFSGIFTS